MPAPINQDQLLQLLDAAGPAHRLPIIKAYLATISDPQQKRFVETLLLFREEMGPSEKEHVVVLLHGIRTRAVWQERMRSRMQKIAPNLSVIPMGYGRFPLLKFLCPWFVRQRVIEDVRAQLRSLVTQRPAAEVSVLAHSFGTYVLSKILRDDPDIRINRVLLCGSIVEERYPWSDIKSNRVIKGAIANDVGTRDYWPPLASHLPFLGYGATGFFGFKHVNVIDNYHNYGHSDFFSDDHLIKYWAPFLLDGQVIFSDWNGERPDYTSYERTALAVKILLATLAALLVLRIFGAA